MFQISKTNYYVVVLCENGDKQATYSFIQNYDETWDDIASSMFYNEFGIKPNRMSIISKEKA